MADMDNILDLFYCNDNDNEADLDSPNENYFIASIYRFIYSEVNMHSSS